MRELEYLLKHLIRITDFTGSNENTPKMRSLGMNFGDGDALSRRRRG